MLRWRIPVEFIPFVFLVKSETKTNIVQIHRPFHTPDLLIKKILPLRHCRSQQTKAVQLQSVEETFDIRATSLKEVPMFHCSVANNFEIPGFWKSVIVYFEIVTSASFVSSLPYDFQRFLIRWKHINSYDVWLRSLLYRRYRCAHALKSTVMLKMLSALILWIFHFLDST